MANAPAEQLLLLLNIIINKIGDNEKDNSGGDSVSNRFRFTNN